MKLTFPPGALRPIDRSIAENALDRAGGAERRRAILRYHEHDERVQRMINALVPGTYVRPHMHRDPDKVEVFLALVGRAAICTFGGGGGLREVIEIAAGGPRFGVEIPAGVWHSLLPLGGPAALYEALEGPWDPATHKRFAPWAPPEGTPEGQAFAASLAQQVAARLEISGSGGV